MEDKIVTFYNSMITNMTAVEVIVDKLMPVIESHEKEVSAMATGFTPEDKAELWSLVNESRTIVRVQEKMEKLRELLN